MPKKQSAAEARRKKEAEDRRKKAARLGVSIDQLPRKRNLAKNTKKK